MKILYYDCFCGISGDMNLGALLDLGVDKDYFTGELSKLHLDGEYEIAIQKGQKKGISGTKVDVTVAEHAHHHEPEGHQGHHDHSNFTEISALIGASDLPDRVKQRSTAIFSRIARAEAKVHGVSMDEVHFHEVGAVDSIVDVVGAAIALEYLQVDTIMASPVQVGGGFVQCAHGLLPVPAPATVEILTNIPVKTGLVPFETTTPTGAAILAANVERFTDQIDFTIERIGYGIGGRDLEIPNVLRVYLGNTPNGEKKEIQYMLETNIDDMNPELFGYIEEKLFERGALDVFKTAIGMKKGRQATKLSVLADAPQEAAILDVIFQETTSLGVRKYPVEKMMLNRDVSKINTEYGEVMVKTAYYQGEPIKFKPEYEDCCRIAKEHRIPIARVYRAVDQAIREGKHE